LIRGAVAATSILAVIVGLAACASSAPRPSTPSSVHGADSRLLGTWQAKEALDAGTVTHADGGTIDYLVFAPKGVLTRYEGDSRVPFRWSTSGNVLTMWETDSGGMTSGIRSDAALHISEAFVALESSRRITYRITPKGLILSGRSRLTHGSFTNRTQSVTALDTFADLDEPDALELLAAAPDPDRAARLTKAKITGALKRARRRNVAARAVEIQQSLRAAALRQPAAVQTAFAAITVSEVRLITALNSEVDTLGEVVAEHFGRHPDAEIYASQPGLGNVLGPRVLAEFGDDPHRFADGKGRKNYAST
jgi:hypothetical protein